MTPAVQDNSPDVVVNSTTYTSGQFGSVDWSGVSASLAGTTLSLTADHYMYSAGYGMSLTGSAFAATRNAPVLTIGRTSFSPTVVNQITWASGTTSSIPGEHLTITPPSGGGTIAAGTTTAGSFNVNGALHVAGDITSTGDLGCNGVLATQLTVSGTGSSIPGFEMHNYESTTTGLNYLVRSGAWSTNSNWAGAP